MNVAYFRNSFLMMLSLLVLLVVLIRYETPSANSQCSVCCEQPFTKGAQYAWREGQYVDVYISTDFDQISGEEVL